MSQTTEASQDKSVEKANISGVENANQLGKHFMAQMVAPTSEDMLEFFDSNQDGKISKNEFVDALEELAQEKGMPLCSSKLAEVVSDFNKHDFNGDGFVSLAELKSAMFSLI